MAKKSSSPDLSGLTHEDKDRLILALLARLDALESKVTKNSHNSSKPPSSDGLAKKTSSLRESSGKSPGGQIGHKGTTLKQVAQPSRVVEYPLPEQCKHCHSQLSLSDVNVAERRQVFDVPMTPFEVVEHRTLALTCRCGQVHVSTFPDEISETVQYGPQVRALGVHLTQGQMLPYARAAELIKDLYQLTISPATLLAWTGEASAKLQSSADLIAELLHHGDTINADESGLRVAGKLHWLHIAANEKLTWYGMHAKRGLEAMDEHGILPNYLGVLVHDCWAPYWKLDQVKHALCNAHLLRELLYAKEITGQKWPEKMSQFLLNANLQTETARQTGIPLSPVDILTFRIHYEAIVCEGEELHPEAIKVNGKRGRVKQSIAYNLLRRFRQHADAILLFMSNDAAPFTNNMAERAVRMPKVKQKISGCFRTLVGAENFCIIRTCLDTLRKQGHGMLEVLKQAFTGNPIQPTA